MKFDKTKETAIALPFRALGHPMRIWMLRQLRNGNHCVGEFVEAIGVEFATVSRHLARLRRAGLVVSQKRGREIWYSLNRNALDALAARLTGHFKADG